MPTNFVDFDTKVWEMSQVFPEVGLLIFDLGLVSRSEYERFETEQFIRRSVELSNDLRKELNFDYTIDYFVAGCILNGGCSVGSLFD